MVCLLGNELAKMVDWIRATDSDTTIFLATLSHYSRLSYYSIICNTIIWKIYRVLEFIFDFKFQPVDFVFNFSGSAQCWESRQKINSVDLSWLKYFLSKFDRKCQHLTENVNIWPKCQMTSALMSVKRIIFELLESVSARNKILRCNSADAPFRNLFRHLSENMA